MKLLSSHREETGQESCIDIFLCALPEEIPFLPWTPEHPYLYPLSVEAGEDHVESYFAMRTVDACRDEKGIPRFCLNHEPVFLNGVLDQGYWPDGLMTAPADEAFVYDICFAKSLGFNMIRKHIKVEPLRWYYHCDRLGIIVWQDMVNGGSSYNIPLVSYLVTVLPFMGKRVRDDHYRLLSRESREGREEWERECHDTVKHLKGVPSIAIWGLFNEGWGQFDSARITDDIRAQDPTRLIDSASGWFDQGAGDFRSVHNYFRKLKVEKSPDRIFAITEYGGLSCQVKGHASTESVYGYQKFDTPEEMERRFLELRATVESLICQGLSAAVYTQLSDIEEEVNGLVTYDRKFVKSGN